MNSKTEFRFSISIKTSILRAASVSRNSAKTKYLGAADIGHFGETSAACIMRPYGAQQKARTIWTLLLGAIEFKRFPKSTFIGLGPIFVFFLNKLVTTFQGRSQPHSPGWARVPGKSPLSSFFPQILINFSNFSSNFTYFLPHFGPPDGRVAHPGRPWLRHCYISSNDT